MAGEQGRWKETVDACGRALELLGPTGLDETRLLVLITRATAHVALEQHAPAGDDFERAAWIESDQAVAASWLRRSGQSYLSAKKYSAAEPVLRRSIEQQERRSLGSEAATTMEALASALRELGKKDEAEKWSARAVSIMKQK
jgi:tetratricopeptide (TPR) repeat protein